MGRLARGVAGLACSDGRMVSKACANGNASRRFHGSNAVPRGDGGPLQPEADSAPDSSAENVERRRRLARHKSKSDNCAIWKRRQYSSRNITSAPNASGNVETSRVIAETFMGRSGCTSDLRPG